MQTAPGGLAPQLVANGKAGADAGTPIDTDAPSTTPPASTEPTDPNLPGAGADAGAVTKPGGGGGSGGTTGGGTGGTAAPCDCADPEGACYDFCCQYPDSDQVGACSVSGACLVSGWNN